MVAVAISAADYSQGTAASLTVSLTGLRAGHVLVSNIETVDGRLLFATGLKLTETIVERVQNYHRVNKIKEPIKVIINSDDQAEEKIAV